MKQLSQEFSLSEIKKKVLCWPLNMQACGNKMDTLQLCTLCCAGNF